MSATPHSSSAGIEVVPADTIRYTYDVIGNVLTTRNLQPATTVTRSYYADGSIRSQKVTLPSGTDSTAFSYDATGAPTRMARSSAGITDVVTYAYDTNTGDLQTMTVQWGSPALTRTFSFAWDKLGRRRQITYPSLVVEGQPAQIVAQFRYDKQGVLRRLVSNNSADAFNVNDRFDLTFRADSVDPTGRILSQTKDCNGYHGTDGGGTGSACSTTFPGKVWSSNRYDRLGQLVTQRNVFPTMKYEYDAAGNMIMRQIGEDTAVIASRSRATACSPTRSRVSPPLR